MFFPTVRLDFPGFPCFGQFGCLDRAPGVWNGEGNAICAKRVNAVRDTRIMAQNGRDEGKVTGRADPVGSGTAPLIHRALISKLELVEGCPLLPAAAGLVRLCCRGIEEKKLVKIPPKKEKKKEKKRKKKWVKEWCREETDRNRARKWKKKNESTLAPRLKCRRGCVGFGINRDKVVTATGVAQV